MSIKLFWEDSSFGDQLQKITAHHSNGWPSIWAYIAEDGEGCWIGGSWDLLGPPSDFMNLDEAVWNNGPVLLNTIKYDDEGWFSAHIRTHIPMSESQKATVSAFLAYLQSEYATTLTTHRQYLPTRVYLKEDGRVDSRIGVLDEHHPVQVWGNEMWVPEKSPTELRNIYESCQWILNTEEWLRGTTGSASILQRVAQHANTPPDIIWHLMEYFPADAARNPALPLLLLEDPGGLFARPKLITAFQHGLWPKDLWDRFDRILSPTVGKPGEQMYDLWRQRITDHYADNAPL